MAKGEKIMKICFQRQIYGHTLEIAKLFTAFSNLEVTETVAKEYEYDAGLNGMVRLVETGAGRTFCWNYVDMKKEQMTTQRTNCIVVCFSGGRDSTATAMMYMKKGYDVHLYHVNGINRSYPEEERAAAAVARHLGLPMTVETVRQHGWTDFPDNPVKNQLIASMAMDYAVRNGIGCDVAVGDTYTHSTKNSSFREAWSDCVEMWKEWEKYVSTWVAGCKIHIPFKDQTETMDMVTSDASVMPLIQSCVLPYRFRGMTKEGNERKYGVSLMPNRCGSCWKCCTEWIRLADMGRTEYVDGFYGHCLKVLRSKMKELKPDVPLEGLCHIDVMNATYRSFLFSDFTKTRYYREHYGIDKC